VDQHQAGVDDEVLARLYADHFASIVRMAWALCGDATVAEELTQEAFVRLYLHRQTLRDAAAAPAYLRRTVANLAIDRGRRRARRPDQPLEPAGEVASASSATSDARPGMDVDLVAALDQLPARRRACVILRYHLDLSEAETAQALGISTGTVKSQTHKALAQLRQHLGDDLAAATRKED